MRLAKNWVLNTTYFLNDRIVDATGATERDYDRYRIDLNFKFWDSESGVTTVTRGVPRGAPRAASSEWRLAIGDIDDTGGLFVVLVGLSLVAYWLGKSRALAVVGGSRGMRNLHSLPSYYGALTALVVRGARARGARRCGSPFRTRSSSGSSRRTCRPRCSAAESSELGLVLNDVRNVVAGNVSWSTHGQRFARRRRNTSSCAASAAGAHGAGARHRHRRAWSSCARASRRSSRARNAVEKIVEWLLIGCSLIAVLTTIGIVLSVAFEAARFFGKVPWYDFLFGLAVEPADGDPRGPGGSSGAFGAVPLFAGTALISGHRDAHRRTDRLVLGDLSRRVRASANSARGPSRSSRCSPAFRRWCTASSPR